MDTKTFAKKLVDLHKQAEHATSYDEREQLKKACYKLCDDEQLELMSRYAESTVIKVHTPKYRKAIAIEANMINDSIKGGYRYTDFPVAYWRVDNAVKNEIDSRTKVNTHNKKSDATRVPVECREKLLNFANDLLSSPTTTAQSIFKKALAISLLTGRRFYVEVCRNAQFFQLDTVTDFNRTLGFIGQAKGGVEKAEQVYELPTYVENIDLLINTTEEVQNFVKSKAWYTDDISAQDFQSKIKSQCELALKDFNQITLPYGFSITIKDLRALYMAFCYYDYKVLTGRMPDMDSYIGSIAGHDAQTTTGTYYRVGITEHYKSFIDARLDG